MLLRWLSPSEVRRHELQLQSCLDRAKVGPNNFAKLMLCGPLNCTLLFSHIMSARLHSHAGPG